MIQAALNTEERSRRIETTLEGIDPIVRSAGRERSGSSEPLRSGVLPSMNQKLWLRHFL